MKKGAIGIILFFILIAICSQNVMSALSQQKDIYENKSELNDSKNDFFPTLMEPSYIPDVGIDHSSLPVGIVDTPAEFSWKNYNGKDFTTPVKNQGNCGSCWDFAATAAIESLVKIRENRPDIEIDLSEQYVLSCLPAAANYYGQGCSGGTPYHALYYIMDDSRDGNFCNGTIPESCFPYEAVDTVPCSNKCEDYINYLVPIADCGEVWIGFDSPEARQAIKSMIYEKGPIPAGLDVLSDFVTFGNYHHRETDYFHFNDQQWVNSLNHMVLIVGWKDDPLVGKGGYWICKNSWGTKWGYDGFFNIEYGTCFLGYYTVWADYVSMNARPDKPLKPTGPASGVTDVELTFSSVSSDSENEDVYYLFDWGDGTNSGWLGPFGSGLETQASHKWEEVGNYNVKVNVKDVHFYQSEWSDSFKVKIPRNNVENRFFLNLLNHLLAMLPKIVQSTK